MVGNLPIKFVCTKDPANEIETLLIPPSRNISIICPHTTLSQLQTSGSHKRHALRPDKTIIRCHKGRELVQKKDTIKFINMASHFLIGVPIKP